MLDESRHGGHWKEIATIVGVAVTLALVVLMALLASREGSPRLNASSEASLTSSIKEMTSAMSEAEKKAFLTDCMDLALPDTMKWAFRNAFLLDDAPSVKKTRLFKPLHGMNAAEIQRNAQEARRASRNANANPPDAASTRPLPGVPSPFGDP